MTGRWYAGFHSSLWNDDDKQVPVQATRRRTMPAGIVRLAHDEYARHHNPSFERLNERGGFGLTEILALLADRIERVEKLAP